MSGSNWTCPFCNRPQTLTDKQISTPFVPIHNDESKYGKICAVINTLRCANPECLELTLTLQLRERERHPQKGIWVAAKLLHKWQLLPESSAKPLPDYIPKPISQDYYETCRIRDLSPKASATLSRRCLQGMIRDFCGISRGRLIDEIEELRRKMDAGEAPRHVSADTVDAIDHVRKIGNIGAHMEKDIDVIVDVDPGEAQKLIELIELLVEEWYIQRERRNQRLVELGAVAAAKDEAKHAEPRAAPEDGENC